MSRNVRGSARGGIVMLLAALVAGSASAQRDFSSVTIRTTDLGSGLAMLEGAGGNLAVSVGDDGVFLVDDQYAPLTEKIRAAIAALSPEPIRFVLNTHWHGDHTGGNENLGRAGASILAHRNVRARLSVAQVRPGGGAPIPAAPAAAWPILTYEDGVTLHLNGQTIEVQAVPPAHTDGDSIVHFREADVLHLGDTFFNGLYPFIDVASGGRVDGMIAAAERSLALAGPATRIVPGHGPLATRGDLADFRTMLEGIRDRVRKLIREGRSRDEVIAARPSRDFDARYGGGFLEPARFVGIVHDSLRADVERTKTP